MNKDIQSYNDTQSEGDRDICNLLAREIDRGLPEAENKIWHAHPVWFLEGNPVVGYSKLKNCIRLLFWSGQSFDEPDLQNEGSFKAAEARYTSVEQVNGKDLERWLNKARDIQWDYKNIVKRKGVLKRLFSLILPVILIPILSNPTYARQILVDGEPVQLDVRQAGETGIRITLRPYRFTEDFPHHPALAEQGYPAPQITTRDIDGTISSQVGNLNVTVRPDPLTITVRNRQDELVQYLVLQPDGRFAFRQDDAPILGLGEGGPPVPEGVNWRDQAIQFDRRGAYDRMRPRWQRGLYGSRNPVPLLIGTGGWAIFVTAPWVEMDLRDDNLGYLVPWEPTSADTVVPNRENQWNHFGKGLIPLEQRVPGLIDLFVFDAHEPAQLMKDISSITGKAVMPPRWAFGYMQSHRTLEDDEQMVGIVDTFREKNIPVDAMIYLGTGFTPQGWNTQQPSFDFNPEVFHRNPEAVISDMHQRNVKVAVHMVPWDRDELPTLHGSIPPEMENPDAGDLSHIRNYWQQHIPLVETGIDAWWPDEGDWYNLFERMKRHQMYYQGPLSTRPDVRPWSLHRNGFLGISKWGGWVWSGDTDSSWKTLQTQIAVAINHSLSLSPYWGSDIGGFFPNEELTGELYARWFQFGAFSPSFRSHGQTWWTRLPWGWGLSEMGPIESGSNPLPSELDNDAIEPVAKEYAELRYRLLPYNYTLAWEASSSGMPLMRSLWLHYPEDSLARQTADSYLWGRDLLIAPVYEENATGRQVYLPEGEWYDWWTHEKVAGGQVVTRPVDLSTMPIYVRAGAIIPLDPVRQYTGEEVDEPTTLQVYTGTDGNYTLYDDDGESLDYLDGDYTLTRVTWNDSSRTLTLEPAGGNWENKRERHLKIELVPGNQVRGVVYSGERVQVQF